MIRFLKHNKIDKVKWDLCINNSINPSIYALSWYLDIVAKNWNALVEDDYISVFPIPIKNKFGIKYSLQPYWTQQLGLFSTKNNTKHELQEFLNLIPNSIFFYQINLNFGLLVDKFKKLKVVNNNNFCLELNQDFETIYSNFSKNLKRNLKQCNNLNVSRDLNIFEIIELFKTEKGKLIKNLNEYSYNLLIEIAKSAKNNNQLELWGAFDGEKLCAGAMFVLYKNKAVLIFSGVSLIGKTNNSMHYLISEFIKVHQKSNLVLDFEGSNIESLARFYRSFGAVNIPYSTIYKNNLPVPFKFLKMLKSL